MSRPSQARHLLQMGGVNRYSLVGGGKEEVLLVVMDDGSGEEGCSMALGGVLVGMFFFRVVWKATVLNGFQGVMFILT